MDIHSNQLDNGHLAMSRLLLPGTNKLTRIVLVNEKVHTLHTTLGAAPTSPENTSKRKTISSMTQTCAKNSKTQRKEAS